MGTDLETTVDSLLKLRTITKFAGDHRRTNHLTIFSFDPPGNIPSGQSTLQHPSPDYQLRETFRTFLRCYDPRSTSLNQPNVQSIPHSLRNMQEKLARKQILAGLTPTSFAPGARVCALSLKPSIIKRMQTGIVI